MSNKNCKLNRQLTTAEAQLCDSRHSRRSPNTTITSCMEMYARRLENSVIESPRRSNDRSHRQTNRMHSRACSIRGQASNRIRSGHLHMGDPYLKQKVQSGRIRVSHSFAKSLEHKSHDPRLTTLGIVNHLAGPSIPELISTRNSHTALAQIQAF